MNWPMELYFPSKASKSFSQHTVKAAILHENLVGAQIWVFILVLEIELKMHGDFLLNLKGK